MKGLFEMRRIPVAIAAAALCLGVAGGALAESAQQATTYSPSPAPTGPIVAPTTVDPGQRVEVTVDDAVQGARIELWGPIGASGEASKLATAPLVGGVATLTAPEKPASYQLRYVRDSGKMLARRAFDVAAIPVVLTVGTPVEAGATLSVKWQGPAQPGDHFQIVSVSGERVDSIPVAGDPSAVNVSRITAPSAPGTYELRYVTGANAVLRAIQFDVR